MNKKTIMIILLGAAVIAGGAFWLLNNKENQPWNNKEGEAVLFYGEGCPHCANVEQFINGNKMDEKLSFERKEVYYNKENAKELSQIAQKCGLDTASIGVPFLWSGSECFIGDKDIIEFFKQKISG